MFIVCARAVNDGLFWVANLRLRYLCLGVALFTLAYMCIFGPRVGDEFYARRSATAATMTTPSNPRFYSPITLTCTTTPALSGTYQIDDYMMTTLNTMLGYFVANGNSFPANIANIAFIDTSGKVHTFPNLASMQAFYKAVAVYWLLIADYQNRTNAGQSPTLPTSTSSAC